MHVIFFSTNYSYLICYYIFGDDMKKTLILMTVAILLGGISGKALFTKTQTSTVFNEKEEIYFLQEGVYEKEESVTRNTKDIDPKLVIKEDDKYYVYVGISSNTKNIEKIKKIYEEKGYNTYQKTKKVSNKEFLANIKQYDVLIESAKDESDILTIEEVVLSNYEETISN